jgi:hypothetical protein
MPETTKKEKDAAAPTPEKGSLTKEEQARLITALYEALCRAGWTYEGIVEFGKAIYAGIPIAKLKDQAIGYLAATVRYLDTSGALDSLRAKPAAKADDGNGKGKAEPVRPDEVAPPKKKGEKEESK